MNRSFAGPPVQQLSLSWKAWLLWPETGHQANKLTPPPPQLYCNSLGSQRTIQANLTFIIKWSPLLSPTNSCKLCSPASLRSGSDTPLGNLKNSDRLDAALQIIGKREPTITKQNKKNPIQVNARLTMYCNVAANGSSSSAECSFGHNSRSSTRHKAQSKGEPSTPPRLRTSLRLPATCTCSFLSGRDRLVFTSAFILRSRYGLMVSRSTHAHL